MISLRERILQAMIARLTPVASAHGASLHRQPTVPTPRDQLPALVIFPDAESVRRLNDRTTRELTIRIVALAVGTPTMSPHRRVDELMNLTHAILMADLSLGGLALSVEEIDTTWQLDDTDGEATALSTQYRIHYRTQCHDLTQPG